MKHIMNFYELNEAKIAKKDTKDVTFNINSLIQIVDDNDKNIGYAKINKALKNQYNVFYKGNSYKIDKKDLVINIHGQIQTEKINLK